MSRKMECAYRRREGTRFTMQDIIIKRLANLLSVKSLVTLALTVVFAVLACRGALDQSFMTIYTVIVSFYFGVQTAKTGGDE